MAVISLTNRINCTALGLRFFVFLFFYDRPAGFVCGTQTVLSRVTVSLSDEMKLKTKQNKARNKTEDEEKEISAHITNKTSTLASRKKCL